MSSGAPAPLQAPDGSNQARKAHLSDASEAKDPKLEPLRYLWDEYRYRHELCWSAVYKVTAAVVALGIVPYAGNHLADRLDWYLLLPPLLGTIFAVFSFRLIRAEFSIWHPIKATYSNLQRQYCLTLVHDNCERKSLNKDFDKAEACKNQFGRRVTEFLVCLIVLSTANCAYIGIHYVGAWFTARIPIHLARPFI